METAVTLGHTTTKGRPKRIQTHKAKHAEGVCEICGHTYEQFKRNRRTCGSANCQQALKDRYAKKYRTLAAWRAKKRRFEVCEICGKSYLASSAKRRTCGSEECQKILARKWAQYYRIQERALRANGQPPRKKKPGQKDDTITPVNEYIAKERQCIRCDKWFMSEWAGERVCPTCRNSKSSEYD